ncbi:vegetative cell wall protein gp1-like [Vombatus ursinus]|uniref:vegetative cell wall protein gp1-like n=1 Tax=Vombatus ursinus TaxID=29139 RepID=UPI000FFDBF85|nr:vegetative cell wall protein gp1-like [Vombatus ursinus]XP_027705244.1 vegetative cell wall protein gp1-like [Vombatus ursinus]
MGPPPSHSEPPSPAEGNRGISPNAPPHKSNFLYPRSPSPKSLSSPMPLLPACPTTALTCPTPDPESNPSPISRVPVGRPQIPPQVPIPTPTVPFSSVAAPRSPFNLPPTPPPFTLRRANVTRPDRNRRTTRQTRRVSARSLRAPRGDRQPFPSPACPLAPPFHSIPFLPLSLPNWGICARAYYPPSPRANVPTGPPSARRKLNRYRQAYCCRRRRYRCRCRCCCTRVLVRRRWLPTDQPSSRLTAAQALSPSSPPTPSALHPRTTQAHWLTPRFSPLPPTQLSFNALAHSVLLKFPSTPIPRTTRKRISSPPPPPRVLA